MHSEPAYKQQAGGAWVLRKNLQLDNLNQQMHLFTCVCACMCTSVFHRIHMEIREEPEESIITFYHVGHGE